MTTVNLQPFLKGHLLELRPDAAGNDSYIYRISRSDYGYGG